MPLECAYRCPRSDSGLSALSWLLRGLLGLGGAFLVYFTWPIAWGAWYAQQADAVVVRLRDGKPVNRADAFAAIEALDLAVLADPSASNHLRRSEVLAGAAGGLDPAAPDSQRDEWLRTAERDLEIGLGGAPARGIAWLRLAAVQEALAGPSPTVARELLLSIETAPVVPLLWPARLELILSTWDSFTDAERERIAAYVAMTWLATTDRRLFVRALRRDVDELYLRLLLSEVPGAQEELSVWIGLVRR